MEIKQFLNARFLAPPIIVVFFIFLADSEKFIGYINKYNGAVGLFVGTVFIFGIGFLISSFATLFINWATGSPSHDSRFPSRATLNKISVDKAKKLFPFLPKNDSKKLTQTEKEVAIWLTIADDKKDKYLREQLHKRWHVFNASFNSFIGLLFVFFFVVFRQSYFSDWQTPSVLWWLIFLVSVVVFLLDSVITYQSVQEIDNIMVRRYKKK